MNMRPGVSDVAAFLSLKKSLVRRMEWTERPSNKIPRWQQFESICYLGSSLSEEVVFRAHYRPAGVRTRGNLSIPIPETFYVSIYIREPRVYAIDTQPGQRHTNVIVPGRSYSGQTITATTHVHLWTDVGAGDGYVEPVEPPLLELEELIENFCVRVNLQLNGNFSHPEFGKTRTLL
ncbi:hypothetical protein ACLB1G_12720 [Oxalobacteraceae bacterium A2-2]